MRLIHQNKYQERFEFVLLMLLVVGMDILKVYICHTTESNLPLGAKLLANSWSATKL